MKRLLLMAALLVAGLVQAENGAYTGDLSNNTPPLRERMYNRTRDPQTNPGFVGRTIEAPFGAVDYIFRG